CAPLPARTSPRQSFPSSSGKNMRPAAASRALGKGSPPMRSDVRPSGSRLACRIADWLEPKNWIIAVTLLVGWHTAQWTGVAWGVVGALFAAVIPITFIKYGIRKGHWGDRHVGAKPARLGVMAVSP